jgi:hypothetical protein
VAFHNEARVAVGAAFEAMLGPHELDLGWQCLRSGAETLDGAFGSPSRARRRAIRAGKIQEEERMEAAATS